MISPLAYVDPSARIGTGVEIRPFAYIDKDVVIGDNCTIHPHATILAGTTMGTGNTIHSGAVIGAEPQDFHYVSGTPSHVEIGNDNCIRENVVIALGYEGGKGTRIGDGNFLMDRVHVCHDANITNKCVVGIGSIVGADSEIDEACILTNSVLLSPGVRTGRYCLVQSGCRVQKDVPPYAILGGNPSAYHGVNSVVLKHCGVSERILRHIANAYRIVYTGNFSLADAMLRIREQIPDSEEIRYITSFISASRLGLVGRASEGE